MEDFLLKLRTCLIDPNHYALRTRAKGGMLAEIKKFVEATQIFGLWYEN